MKSALTWMHGQQNEDGSFAIGGQDATVDEKIHTTAFVLTCLSDVQHDDIVIKFIETLEEIKKS